MTPASTAPALALHWRYEDDRRPAELFGGETGDDVDTFGPCRWRPGPAGAADDRAAGDLGSPDGKDLEPGHEP